MAGGSTALTERVVRLEDIVGAPEREDALSLSEKYAQLKVEFDHLRFMLESHMMQTDAKIEDMGVDSKVLKESVVEGLAAVKEDVVILKRAVVSSNGEGDGRSRAKIPEPKPFGGARSAKELENFLWDVEQYFRAAKVPVDEQVSITSMYLSEDAKLWWRTRVEDTTRPEIRLWSDLKNELKEQFLPSNSGWQAREALRNLKHDGSMRDYVKDFTSLMLDIRGMAEEDKVFNFVAGLQPWAQAELRRKSVRDLQSAIAVADSLVDLKLDKADTSSKSKKQQGKFDSADKGKEIESENGKGKQRTDPKNNKAGPKDGCFICRGPHWAKDCPRKEALAALVAENSEHNSNLGAEVRPSVMRLSGLQVAETAGDR